MYGIFSNSDSDSMRMVVALHMYARICNVDTYIQCILSIRRGRGNKNDNSRFRIVVPSFLPSRNSRSKRQPPSLLDRIELGLDGQMPAYDPRQRRVPALSAGAMSRRFEGIKSRTSTLPYKYGVWRDGGMEGGLAHTRTTDP